MLRNYEGIMDNPVSVYEKQLAWFTQKKPEEVKEDLFVNRRLALLITCHRKKRPATYFILNRAPAQFLNLNHEQYLQRKKSSANG